MSTDLPDFHVFHPTPEKVYTVREYINELNRMIITEEIDEDAIVQVSLFHILFPAKRPKVGEFNTLIVG